jgi:hypothetical protein
LGKRGFVLRLGQSKKDGDILLLLRESSLLTVKESITVSCAKDSKEGKIKHSNSKKTDANFKMESLKKN